MVSDQGWGRILQKYLIRDEDSLIESTLRICLYYKDFYPKLPLIIYFKIRASICVFLGSITFSVAYINLTHPDQCPKYEIVRFLDFHGELVWQFLSLSIVAKHVWVQIFGGLDFVRWF